LAEPINPPRAILQFLEARAPLELSALLLQWPLLRATVPHGDGDAVIVLPGFLADDASTWMLRRFLDGIGYDARPWGQGANTGPGAPLIEGVLDLANALVKSHGAKVNLVGWSRGGIIAREVARARGDLVRQVITLGTPVRGGPGASSIGRLVASSLGVSAQDLRRIQENRERTPIRVPITAVYSRSDGVVAWQAAIDDRSPDVEHVEVESSHVGLGVNAEVYRIVARRLARPRPAAAKSTSP
jgi:pimeloyl-ACP methyl ester carboxylesterase